MLPAKEVLQEIVNEATNMMLERQMGVAKKFATDFRKLKKSGCSLDEIRMVMRRKYGKSGN